MQDLVKIKKEGGEHPRFTDSRVCVCGNPIFAHERDEEHWELIYETACTSCIIKWRRSPEENQAISDRYNAEWQEYAAKRLCSICDSSKPMPHARWCAKCCIKINLERIKSGEGGDGTVWAINYAMKFL